MGGYILCLRFNRSRDIFRVPMFLGESLRWVGFTLEVIIYTWILPRIWGDKVEERWDGGHWWG